MGKTLIAIVVVVIGGGVWLLAGRGEPGASATGATLELLNVSYDPTRELWRDVNARFIEHYQKEKGVALAIKQSHAGSANQARAIIDGLEGDVVTLALWSDTQAIQRKGLIESGWDDRFPNRSLPYTSTIVFVVRRGNPKNIRDWADLVKPGVEIITPNPRTSGNGKLSFLAAWGAVLQKGGSEEQARAFVTQLYRQVPVLDTGARGATVTFAQRNIGDVHLTWENEAHFEVQEAKGALEIVYPSTSILAEPHVAVVDAVVRRKGTREAAEAYLRFLYTPQAQEVIARHFFRPADADILRKHAATFPGIELFSITAIARDWDEAQRKFFASGAIFDQIFRRPK